MGALYDMLPIKEISFVPLLSPSNIIFCTSYHAPLPRRSPSLHLHSKPRLRRYASRGSAARSMSLFAAPPPLLAGIASHRACTPLHARNTHNALNARKSSRQLSRQPRMQTSAAAGTTSAPAASFLRMDARQALRLVSWLSFGTILLICRPFFAVVLGTFIVGYVANSAVAVCIRVTKGRVPRRVFVVLFYAVIVTAIAAFSVMTIPTVVRESQYFISTLQSENPYVILANTARKVLGEELAEKVEAFLSFSMDAPAAGGAVMSVERSRRFGVLLQQKLSTYVSGAAALITRLVRASTKVIFKALLSLVFSFMVIWDMDRVTKGVQSLQYSRISFMYNDLAPAIREFGSVVGKGFEAQAAIAVINTTLTTGGLVLLGIPGVGFLSVVTLLCSFIPVAGVFISTFPMVILALSEYGVAKAMAVVFMVLLVHLLEAYVLNPQIYSAHLHLHPLFVIVVLYVAEHSFGIPGLLLAVPVSVYFLRAVVKLPGHVIAGNGTRELKPAADAA